MYNVEQMIPYNGILPSLADDVFLAPGARLIGDVFIGSESSVWFNCILRGDVNYIRVGEKTNIQDGTVVHVSSSGYYTIIGNNVTIGHNAIIHGCIVNDYVLIGMGATILDGSVVEEMSFIAAGALVTPRSVVKKNELCAGNPAKCIRLINDKEKQMIVNTPDIYSDLRKDFLKK